MQNAAWIILFLRERHIIYVPVLDLGVIFIFIIFGSHSGYKARYNYSKYSGTLG